MFIKQRNKESHSLYSIQNTRYSILDTRRAGFTLVELVVTIGIATILMSLGLFISMDFYRRYTFYAERTTILGALRRAREYSFANANSVPHGVKIIGNQYVIFTGASYAARNAQYDEPIEKSANITASGISEVVFSPLAATSTASGTITVSNGIQSSDIEINYEGKISW